MSCRKKLIAAAMVLSSSLVLTGCGLFPEMIDLSDEDTTDIAVYCAHAVCKFNINQDEGMVFVPHNDRGLDTVVTDQEIEELADAVDEFVDALDSEDESEDESEDGDPEDEGQEEPDDEEPPAPEDEELPIGEEDEGDSEADEEDSESTTEAELPLSTERTVTLTDAVGVKGISFIYKGAKVSTDYRSGDVYDLTPDDGYELLVMRIKAKNNTNKDINMDLTQYGLRFQADYEGQVAKSKATLLLNDMTTFEGEVRAQKTKNMIILFQFPIGTVRDADNIKMTLPRRDETLIIDLALSSK